MAALEEIGEKTQDGDRAEQVGVENALCLGPIFFGERLIAQVSQASDGACESVFRHLAALLDEGGMRIESDGVKAQTANPDAVSHSQVPCQSVELTPVPSREKQIVAPAGELV